MTTSALEFSDQSLSERWKRVHVQQWQYMLQIVKCNDQSCCKFHTKLPYLFF